MNNTIITNITIVSKAFTMKANIFDDKTKKMAEMMFLANPLTTKISGKQNNKDVEYVLRKENGFSWIEKK